MTLKRRSARQKHGAKEMAVTRTVHDPVEDFGMDKSIAIVIAEAFQIKDARCICHPLEVPLEQKEWLRWSAKQACPANRSIALSVKRGTLL